MFLKKVLILISFILFLAGCDLVDSDKKNDVDSHKLESLTVNGNVITLEAGIFNYRYLLNSADGSTTNVLIDAIAKENGATVSGIGNKTVNNPTVVVDPFNSEFYQRSTETDFIIEVTSAEGTSKTSYTVTISSAPLWAEAVLTFSGDGSELEGKEAWFRLNSYGQNYLGDFGSFVKLKPSKTQKVAVPLPIEGNYFMYTQLEFIVDLDGDNKYGVGDYVGFIENVEIEMSKNSIYQMPDMNLYKANRIEITNMPVELINSDVSWRDGMIVYRDINTGEMHPVYDYDVDDGRFIYRDHPVLGTYELLVTDSLGFLPLGSAKAINLGVHNFRDTDDLVFNASDYTLTTYSELGSLLTSFYQDPVEIVFTFSETMNKSSVENAIKLYNAEKYYRGDNDAEINLSNHTWSDDDKTITINYGFSFNVDYLLVLENTAKNLTGDNIYFSFKQGINFTN